MSIAFSSKHTGSDPLCYEIKIESLPYSKKRDHCCPEGTLANAFSNNKIYKTRIDTWDKQNPMKRITKLRDELRIQLKL